MTTRSKGSVFSFADQGIFTHALDVGCTTAASAAANRTALIAAFTSLTSVGGVIVVPHGVSHNFVSADFPVSANPLCLLTLKGAELSVLCNQSHTTTLGDLVKIAGQVVGKKQIVVALAAGSTQVADDTPILILNHPATIASYTVTLPQAPQDGNTVSIFSRSIVTALTLAAGAGESIATGHTLTALTAGQSVEYVYDLGTTSWYRVK